MITHSVMKFCTYMYLENCKNPTEFQVHRSKIKVTGLILYHCEMKPCC